MKEGMFMHIIKRQYLLYHMMLIYSGLTIKMTATLMTISKQHSFPPNHSVIQMHNTYHARFISSLKNTSFAITISPLSKQPEGFMCGLVYVKGSKINFHFLKTIPYSPTHQQHRGLGRLLPVVI